MLIIHFDDLIRENGIPHIFLRKRFGEQDNVNLSISSKRQNISYLSDFVGQKAPVLTSRPLALADKVEQPSPSATQAKNVAAVPFADDSSHI